MTLCNCDKCGRVLLTKYEERCTSCAQLALTESHLVKAYVRANPGATVMEVYHQTGVSLQTIKDLMQA
ncbi:hypothetical protein [Paenibacillus roseipurpureus]|uniref:Flagellar protein n=1 Tax=Paenibacillus roseopurpureus TaxID=2918901 RepID=A0AA96LJJ0_9BACL|nr:hypothetical protein [Paenibacillus sp. MBLB1832]WNR42196.1 hypothetical protein MJB10_13715 [Paenibacillus sp. MBLB1832]